MKQRDALHHIRIATFLVLGILALGITGYMLIEHFSFVDALLTTIEMMSTVGNTAGPLSDHGRLFTGVIIVLGVGSLFYTFGVTMEFMIEGHLRRAIGRHIMDKKIDRLRAHYIICGFGRVGSRVAHEIAAAHRPFVVIDENKVSMQSCLEKGYLALYGDATNDDILCEAGIRYAQVLLAATDQDANNICITLSARTLNPRLYIVARANHDETLVKLKRAGADRVISPYAIGGHRMAKLALQPAVVDFFDTLINAENPDVAIREVVLSVDSPLIGKTIVNAQSLLTGGTIILAIKKGNGLVMGSRLETCIERGDAAILAGNPEQLSSFATKSRQKV